MNKPLQYVQIGVGGFGQHWCVDVLPRLKELGLAVPVAAVDINREILGKARAQLGLADDQLYTSAAQAVAARELPQHADHYLSVFASGVA